MTARVRITVCKPHDLVVSVVALDAEGKVRGESTAFGTQLCEGTTEMTVHAGQSLWIGEGSPIFASNGAQLRQRNNDVTALTEQLTDAHKRIVELETQLAALSEHSAKGESSGHVIDNPGLVSGSNPEPAAKTKGKRSSK